MSQQKWQVLQWAGRLVRFVSLSRLADKVGYGYIAPIALDPEQGDRPLQRRVKLLQSFGFRSAPKVVGSEGLLLAPRAGASNGVAVAVDNLSIGPIDLKEGESAMYGAGGSLLKHDQAGKITVDSSVTQDLVVNGGTLRVARATDRCDIAPSGPLALWLSQVETFINGLAPGTVTPLSSSFVAAPGIKIEASQGSPRFKA